jgi:molecular chaperone DnaK
LIDEAQYNVESDKVQKEILTMKNKLESLLQNSQRSFSEFGWMLAADDQESVRTTLISAKDSLGSDDAATIRRSLEDLENAGKLITEAMFSGGSASGGGFGKGADGEVK